MKRQKNSRQKFLEALYSNFFSSHQGYIEVRIILSGGKVRRYFFHNITRLGQVTFERVNTYFGVCPRSIKAGTAEAIKYITTLWADIDIARGDRTKFASTGEAIRYIGSFPYPPSIIVGTGGGLQLYWLLKEPEEIGHYHREIINGLAQSLHGDPVHDPARLLRLPGTVNTKYTKPRKVTILKFNPDIRYNSSELDEIAMPVQQYALPVNIDGKTLQHPRISRLAIPQRIKNLILEGDRDSIYPSRSERDQAVVNHLVKINCSPAVIRAIFSDPSLPISDKYLEKGRQGDKYLALTIAKARARQNNCYCQ
jgi:hypothetical protein